MESDSVRNPERIWKQWRCVDMSIEARSVPGTVQEFSKDIRSVEER